MKPSHVIESIVARREILAALVEAGQAGLSPDELRSKMPPQVTDTDFKQAVKRLSEGGIASVKQIYRKGGRWFTFCLAAPAPITIGTVVEKPPERDPVLVAEDEAFAREQAEAQETPVSNKLEYESAYAEEVLKALSKAKTWQAPMKLMEVTEATRSAVRTALDELIAKKLVIKAGAGRACTYSLKALKLTPPAKAAKAIKALVKQRPSKRKSADVLTFPDPSKARYGALRKALADLDNEIKAAEDRLNKLRAARDSLKTAMAA